MSRPVQVTFDAHDPRGLSSFWRDVLGYVHPAPPGVDLPEGADPLAAWDYRAKRGWRHSRPSATASSRWERRGYIVKSPRPR